MPHPQAEPTGSPPPGILGYDRNMITPKITPSVCVLAALILCGCPAPGEGPKADAWYRRASPVIAALERYRQEHGDYPETLEQLPVEWLPPSYEGSPDGPRFGYLHRGGHYELSFSYA